jgi:hypothetical protein
MLITLSDIEQRHDAFWSRDAWSSADILPCLEGTGIAALQFAIRQHSLDWAQEWRNLLDLIDKALSTDVSSSSNSVLRKHYSQQSSLEMS